MTFSKVKDKILAQLRSKWFWIELITSVLTILGVKYGTSTFEGAIWYLAGCVFWFYIMVARKMWGLAPLNIFATLAVADNLWKLL
jgi:hypothetical protein